MSYLLPFTTDLPTPPVSVPKLALAREKFIQFQQRTDLEPLFLAGEALTILKQLPSESIDCCMTSPPYWAKREYEAGGLGNEATWQQFILELAAIFKQVHRVLKPAGSCWINLGDTYQQKNLLGLPWRLAFELTDKQGWIMRNSVVWNKVKGGMDNSGDRLGNVHEMLFHFVKRTQDYYYDADAIRSAPRQTQIRNGAVISATGVSGVRYKRQLELSTALSADEKEKAFSALQAMLEAVARGDISDFRMIIRGQQRATHSESTKLSGRAKEVAEKGYCFLRYHPKGSKPTDVWDILPEDSQKRKDHFAPFPVDLCRIPILATCPSGGIVLDPFCGTGTTNYAAKILGRRSVGIDISQKYINASQVRTTSLI